ANAHFQKAIDLDPKNLRAAYALFEATEQQPNGDAQAQSVLTRIVQAQPDNLVAQLDTARLAATRGDAAGLRAAVANLQKRAAKWPPIAQEQFRALKSASAGSDSHAAASTVAVLQNVLKPLPAYRQDYAALKAASGEVALPLDRLLKLPAPPPTPAAPD